MVSVERHRIYVSKAAPINEVGNEASQSGHVLTLDFCERHFNVRPIQFVPCKVPRVFFHLDSFLVNVLLKLLQILTKVCSLYLINLIQQGWLNRIFYFL